MIFGYKLVYSVGVGKIPRFTLLRAFKILEIIEFISGKDIGGCLIHRQFTSFFFFFERYFFLKDVFIEE